MSSAGVHLACPPSRICKGIVGERTGVEEPDAVVDRRHGVLPRLRHLGCAVRLGFGLRGCNKAEQKQGRVSRQS